MEPELLAQPRAAHITRSSEPHIPEPHITRLRARPNTPSPRARSFVQYPFDKTKMAEVREWVNASDLKNVLRSGPGVSSVEVSFCPGEGWLAARYIFDDLDDMVGFLGSPMLEDAKKILATAPHQDPSRAPHEFKGFYLQEV